MPRRRPRHRPEGPSFFVSLMSVIAKTIVLLLAMLSVGELGAGIVLERLRNAQPGGGGAIRDEDLIRLYDTAMPQTYREILEEQSRLLQTAYAPLLEYKMVPAQGKTYSVTEQGYRTNGQSQDLMAAGTKILVFGGSTILGRGVANQETVPAQLGDVLNAAGKSVQVFNFGADEYVIEQERLQFERLLAMGVRADVAVFIDGLTDFSDCRAVPMTAWSNRLSALTGQFTSDAEDVPSRLVQLYQWFNGGRPAKPGNWGRPCENEQAVQASIERVQSNRRLIAALAQSYGVKAVFVQQPVPVHHYDNNRRPVRITSEQLGTYVNAARPYARLAEMHGNQTLSEPQPLWLADLEPPEGNAYIDPIHYSPRFNRAIAEAVARHLLDNSLLP